VLFLVDGSSVRVGSFGVVGGTTVDIPSVGKDLDLVIGELGHLLGDDGRSSLHDVCSSK